MNLTFRKIYKVIELHFSSHESLVAYFMNAYSWLSYTAGKTVNTSGSLDNLIQLPSWEPILHTAEEKLSFIFKSLVYTLFHLKQGLCVVLGVRPPPSPIVDFFWPSP